MVVKQTEKIVVVHPHENFDIACRCKKPIEGLIQGLSGKPEVIVVKGYGENPNNLMEHAPFLVYLDNEIKYDKISSRDGEIPNDSLNGIISSNSRIHLVGCNVFLCYRRGFESLVNYIQSESIHDVEIVFPFDCCYFQHAGYTSYTLGELLNTAFAKVSQQGRVYGKQRFDKDGNLVSTDNLRFVKNVERTLFKYYLLTHRKELILKQPYKIIVTSDEFRLEIK